MLEKTEENKKAPYLWNAEQIFCERNPHFETQRIKAKKFRKALLNSKPLSQMWLYKFGLAKFESFDLTWNKKNKEHITWTDVKNIDEKLIEELTQELSKGDELIFNIHDLVHSEPKQFQKRIVIQ